jgi:hypothetical protein
MPFYFSVKKHFPPHFQPSATVHHINMLLQPLPAQTAFESFDGWRYYPVSHLNQSGFYSPQLAAIKLT